MQDWEIQLAKLFKERNQQKVNGMTKGVVVSPLPNFRVSVGSEIVLDSDLLIVSTTVHNLDPKSGTDVILMPTSNGQKYFVLDGVGAVVSDN